MIALTDELSAALPVCACTYSCTCMGLCMHCDLLSSVSDTAALDRDVSHAVCLKLQKMILPCFLYN